MNKASKGAARGSALHKRLASAARALAMECAAGTAPELIADHFEMGGYRCALGELLARVGGGDVWGTYWAISEGAPHPNGVAAKEASGLLIQANNSEVTPWRRADAVIFPLLYLADMLERRRP